MHATGRQPWVRLLKRVFGIDMQHCPNCDAGEVKIIAAILEWPEIEKILTHLGAGSAASAQGPGARGGARLRRPSRAGRGHLTHQHGQRYQVASAVALRHMSAGPERTQERP